uniref:Isopentenyl diphosphate isomerase n=1 Tax=Rhizophora mucronata TaxID=61149 RepID=A0A2P2JQX4_RHIMU
MQSLFIDCKFMACMSWVLILEYIWSCLFLFSLFLSYN